jgi:dephospho-CoA kinase
MEEKKKIVVGLLGESGSGKDTVAKYLQEKYGAKLMRFADPIKETLHIYFEKISREDQQWLALEFRKRFGADILSRALAKKIENTDGLIVINGIRFWEDYQFVESFTEGKTLYITADQKLRWERVTSRHEKSDDSVSLEQFQEMEKVETEVHISEIGAKADFMIRNEKDLNFLLSETDKVIEQMMKL